MARPVLLLLLLPLLLLLLLTACCCRAEVASGSDSLQLVRYVIRRRLPPRFCLLGKILLLDGQYSAVQQNPEDVETIELGYERNKGERTKAASCHFLSAEHSGQHDWLSGWLEELFPERLVRRVYPAPLTGRSWPKTRQQLDRVARLHTASGAADSYAVLFLSSADDLQS